MPQARLYLLGAARLTIDGQPVPLGPASLGPLLGFLALHAAEGRAVSRARAASTLWPDQPEDRARRALTDALYRLRRACAEAAGPAAAAVVQADDEGLSLGAAWVDAAEFQRLCRSPRLADWRAALALYAGDLLPDVDAEWVLLPRLELQQAYLSTLERAAARLEAEGELSEALALAQRWALIDPLREEAHRAVMRLLARLGRHAAALAHYERLAQLLQAELQVEPLPETRALAEQVRADREWIQRQAAPDGSRLVRPPFVGRVAERARLLARLEQAALGRGGVLAVLGAPGQGKTRLLEELAGVAALRGWHVAWGRAEEFSYPPPYSPLRQALQAALPKPRWQQLAQAVRPAWLSVVEGLLAPPHAGAAAARPDTHPAQLPLALRQVLSALQDIAPHLIILDDVQWADRALWPLLDSLRPALAGGLRVLVLAAGRAEDLRGQPEAWAMVEAGERAGEAALHLPGLSPLELRELGQAATGAPLAPEQVEQLVQASGGSPLLALGLLQTGTPGRLVAEHPSLADMALRRLAPVSESARQALEAASVLGYQFDYLAWQALLAEAGRVAPEALPRLAGELERAGLIVLQAEGYRFAHDVLRAALYAQLPAPARQRLHAQALAVLAERAPDEALVLLYHAAQAGQPAAIARYALRAGEQALASFAPAEAASYFAQALAALPGGDPACYPALLGRVRALDLLAQREAQRQTLQALQQAAAASGHPAQAAEAAHQRARYDWLTGDYESAQAHGERALDLARQAADRRLETAAWEILGQVARDRGSYAQAQACFAQAGLGYAALGSLWGEAVVADQLGIVAQRLGQPREAIAQHSRAAERFAQVGDLVAEARAASNLAIAQWQVGDYAAAQAAFERVLAAGRELGDRRTEMSSLSNLAGLTGTLGDYEASLAFGQQALELARAANDVPVIAGILTNLAETEQTLGQWERALAHYEEALALNRAIGRRRGEAYAEHGRGRALLELGRVPEALAALERARELRAGLDERDTLLGTHATLALAYLAAGNLPAAQAAVEAAFRAHDPANDSAETRQDLHYAAFCVCRALGQAGPALDHLRQAQAAMHAIAALLPAPARERFLQRVPLNQKVQQALAGHSRRALARLVRAGVPLGRKLSDLDYVTIQWTLAAPEDEAVQPAGERRRHVLRRLLAEAEAQGAAPTDGDLAQALGVSRRTILRDMEALRGNGQSAPTRKRKGKDRA